MLCDVTTITQKISIIKKVIFLFVLVFSSIAFSQNTYAACGKVSIGEMNWASGQVVTRIASFILSQGYDCEVELIATSTIPGITSLVEKSEPAFIPEAWVGSTKVLISKGEASGKVTKLGSVFPGAGEYWYVSKYTADEYNIKTIADVIENYALFSDPEQPSKGRFHTCPPGWACQIINENMFNAYGLADKFTLFNSGSGEGLKLSIAKAFNRNEHWFGYYWGPTSVLGKYDLVPLELNDFDVKGFECNTKIDCANPHAGRYPPAEVVKLATTEFANRDAAVTEFIKAYNFPSEPLLKTLAWKDQNQADADQAAGYFMQKYPSVWKAWLPANVVSKIESKL